MPVELLPVSDFRAAAKVARGQGGAKVGGQPVFRVAAGKPKAVDDAKRSIRFVFSDGSVDRAGDTIDPLGWELGAFNENPVALWAHNSFDPPIGRASNVLIEGSRLMGDIEFAAADVYAFGDTIYRMVKAGYINAVSVGFMPIDYKWADDDDARPWGIDFLKQELMEISVVPVPCNANALLEARAKGIDTRPLVEWAERTLDGGGKVIVPRKELERLRAAAKEPPAPQRQARRDPTGASETDPTSGGALVATCGRAHDAECGLKNPEECNVHKTQADEDKRIAALVQKAVQGQLKGVLTEMKKQIADALKARSGKSKIATKPKRKAEGDDEQDDPMEKAFGHFDSAAEAMDRAKQLRADADEAHQEAVDHYDEAMKCLRSIGGDADDDEEGKAEDDDEPGDDDEKADDDAEDDEAAEKAARKRLQKRLAKHLKA